VSKDKAVSNKEVSQSQPTPSRRACHTPATSANALTYPPEKSTSESPDFTGGPSGAPVSAIHPVSACST
jgi:hypothetical protein